jgi:ATP-dependent Lhr-like helicase
MDNLIIEPLGNHSTKPQGLPDPDSAVEDDTESNLTEILGEWFRFYGPRRIDFIHDTLGIQPDRLNTTIDDLIDSDDIISGRLVTDGPEDDLCDSDNFEILLRMARSEARPSFEPLNIEYLPLFLAFYQGLVHPSDDIDGLFRRIEQLQCYPMPAAAWEADILPARLQPYLSSWLDTILQQGDLRWIGRENQKVAFCFESDLDLLEKEINRHQTEEGSSDKNSDEAHLTNNVDLIESQKLFPDPAGRYNFSSLIQITGDRPAQLSDNIWKGVWLGQITNDTFSALRKGVETRFRLADVLADEQKTRIRTRRAGGRSRFSRWKGSLPYAGNWFLLPEPDLDDDILAVEERNKDRVRILLERYGILFREILQRESEPYRWKSLFRSLRLMELSGEVLSGYFFQGIPGPQFISHRAFRMLQRDLPEEAVYWINAADPASACGLPIDGIRGNLPRRLDSTHLVFRGKELVFVSRKNGSSLRFLVSPDDPAIHEYLGILKHLLARNFQPKRRITIETINGKPAAGSPYLDVIRTHFETVVDHKNITLYRNVE